MGNFDIKLSSYWLVVKTNLLKIITQTWHQEVEIEKTEDLPPEVKVDLGEDNEIVAFRARAKLYRWVTVSWK